MKRRPIAFLAALAAAAAVFAARAHFAVPGAGETDSPGLIPQARSGGPPRLRPAKPDPGPAIFVRAAPGAPRALPGTEPARNPQDLLLLCDDRKIVGWISGTTDHAGRTVAAEIGGRRLDLPVEPGNVFRCLHEGVTEPVEARFTFGTLRRSIRILPAKKLEPAAYLIPDRPAYRPGDELRFAAFLAETDAEGRFVPAAGRKVEVHLASRKKGIKAARFELASDETGRIAGSYRFSQADPLDDYLLSIPGFKGTAQVTLSDFRKARTALRITAREEAAGLQVSFEAADFLGKKAKGSRVRFTEQILSGRETRPASADFVYHEDSPFSGLLDLGEEEACLREAAPWAFPGPASSWVAHQAEGELDLGDAGSAERMIPIPREWRERKCRIRIRGVLTDPNGQEVTSVATFPLSDGKKPFGLKVSRRTSFPGETIPVTAASLPNGAAAVLAAFRLEAGSGAGANRLYFTSYDSAGWNSTPVQFQFHDWNGFPPNGSRHARRAWYPPSLPRSVPRSFVNAVVFEGGRAEISLDEPGAYALVALSNRKGGPASRDEIFCVVGDEAGASPVDLRLDRDGIAPGEPIEGEIRCRYAAARVLLTVRDGKGIRLVQPVDVMGGSVRFSVALPPGSGPGCVAAAQYRDGPEGGAASSRFFRVAPTDLSIAIRAKVPEVCRPGETVKLEIEADRREEVDLVVSVYDRSLRGIGGDPAPDIGRFFLEDERVLARDDRDLLRSLLGAATPASMIEVAERALRDGGARGAAPAQDPDAQALRQAVDRLRQGTLHAQDAVAFLRSAGIPAGVVPSGYWHAQIDPKNPPADFADLLERPCGEVRLMPVLRGGVFLLWAARPGEAGVFTPVPAEGPYFSVGATGNSSFSHRGAALPPAVLEEAAGGGAGSDGTAVRRDFSDSALFRADLRTDENGRASVDFKLPDSITTWRVEIRAVSRKFHVGQASAEFRTEKPLMVWPLHPRIFAAGDIVELKAIVHNRTDQEQEVAVSLKAENGEVLSDAVRRIRLEAMGSATVQWTYKAGKAGITEILWAVEGPAGSDGSVKRLPVGDPSARQALTASGFCREPAAFEIPKGADLKDASFNATLVPTIEADLEDTLPYLLDYPHGCVEQTMSRFLPCVRVAQILKGRGIVRADLEQKVPAYVAAGVKRLLELQQADGGWGWNGTSATHEMMTPYALHGLLEAERAGHRLGAEAAVERGLLRLRGFIGAMGEAQASDRIYCLYVLSLREPLAEGEWAFIRSLLDRKKLSDYAAALALEMAVKAERTDLSHALADRLRAAAQRSGDGVFWKTAGFSRWGDDPNEITAAALKALVAHDSEDPMLPGILSYFAAGKRGNRWNSTKDTAMILCAMCDYVASRPGGEDRGGSVGISVNGGEPVRVRMEAGSSAHVTLPASALRAGRNTVRFEGGPRALLYRLVVRYRQATGDIEPWGEGVAVTRAVHLLDERGIRVRELRRGEAVPRGSFIESEVTAREAAGAGMAYVLVHDPRPAGCEFLPADDPRFRRESAPYVLREDRDAGLYTHHESAPAVLTDRCVLRAEFAGEFTVPPAEVELMYRPEVRGHSGTFRLVVK